MQVLDASGVEVDRLTKRVAAGGRCCYKRILLVHRSAEWAVHIQDANGGHDWHHC